MAEQGGTPPSSEVPAIEVTPTTPPTSNPGTTPAPSPAIITPAESSNTTAAPIINANNNTPASLLSTNNTAPASSSTPTTIANNKTPTSPRRNTDLKAPASTAAPRKNSVSKPKEPKEPKKEGKKGFLKKKLRTGVAVRGQHLHRLVATTRMNRQQILAIANKFVEFAPTGVMELPVFKKALEFDKDDVFGDRLFTIFESEKHSGILKMDDFVIGLSKVAPEADVNVKLDLCYELFDVDANGNVQLAEFRAMTKYSMKHGRFGIEEDKLNWLIDLQWKQFDMNGDNTVLREEFKAVLNKQKAFVNALTLQVPWLQAAFKLKPLIAVDKEYIGTDALEVVVSDVAKQMNAPDEDIQKWSTILHRNLYTDVKSLKEISSTDWTSMELPRRLYTEIDKVLDPAYQSSSEIIAGRVKHNVALSDTLSDRVRIYIEYNKNVIFFFSLYLFANLAMIAWTLTKYLTDHIGTRYHDQYRIIGASFIISRVAGALAKFNFALLLFPVCYRTMTWLRASYLEHFLPIDTAMKFHRRVGVFIFVMGLTHMIAHCVNFLRLSRADVDAVNDAFGFYFVEAPTQAQLHSTRTGVTGWIMVGLMLILVFTAIEKVRRAHFRLFFSIHHLYIPILIALVIHDGLINPVEIIYWMIPGFVFFLIERGVTLWRGVPVYRSLEGTRILKGDVLALCIQKPPWFKYSPGHYVWINCPSVSRTEWHPFTLTSSPDEPHLMVDINCIGDWTKKLKETYSKDLAAVQKQEKGKEREEKDHVLQIELDNVATKNSPHANAREAEMMVPVEGKLLPAIRVDGPYGTASGDVLLYTHVVLIGGGIGVTPFISILKSIRHAVLYTNNCPLHAVHFIWVTKNQENFQWFSMMLADLQRHEDLRGFLRVSIYLTGTRHPINDIRLLGVSLLMNKAKQELNEDLVTGLEGQTHFGRPNFSEILLQHNKEWAGNEVGVFFCGPEPLAQAIRVTCRALNNANRAPVGKNMRKKGAQFFFRQEHF